MLVDSGEATKTHFAVFGLTQTEIEHMIYHTLSEQSKHYNTGLVVYDFSVHYLII